MPLRYGKEIEEVSYVDGKVASAKRSVQIPIKVDGELEALSAIGSALREDMSKAENHKMTIEVIGDPKTGEPIRVIKRYQIERS